MKIRFIAYFTILIFFLIPQTIINAESLIYPHIATSGNWNTEICVINTSAKSVTGNFNFFNENGGLVTTSKITLTPGARHEVAMGSAFPKATNIAYAFFESETASVSGYTRFFIKGTYRAAVPALFLKDRNEIYLPHIASSPEWWTGVALVNTLSKKKEVVISFNTGITKTITLAPGVHTTFSIRTLFKDKPQPNIKSAYISNAQGITGLELFGCNAENQLSGMLLKGETNKELFFPHVARHPWWTGIVVYNPSLSSCDMTIKTYNKDGKQLSTIKKVILARGKYIGNSVTLNFPSDTAWFKVDGSSALTGFELFGRPGQLGGYVSVNLLSKQGYFPKIDKTGWTGVAFVNVTEKKAAIVLSAFNDTGNQIASKLFTMAPGTKIVKNARGFFKADISQATYIRYVSDQNIAGFQLNGNDPDKMLDALPALPAKKNDTYGLGRFYDALVIGLDYEHGKENRTTLDGGIFLFRKNTPITFSIGNIILGQGYAKKIMTPLDIVTDAQDETNNTVTNIVRLLITLDDDNNLENGIFIPDNVKTAATAAINFAQTPVAFQEDKSVIDMVKTLTTLTAAGVRTLVTAKAARSHMKTTLLSLLAGTYSGAFTGDEAGEWAVVIDDKGDIEGAGINTRTGDFGISGTSQSNGAMLVIGGSAANTATYTGTITRQGKMSGSWREMDGDTGTYTGNKDDKLTDPYLLSAVGRRFTFKNYRQTSPSYTWESSIDILGISTAKGYPRIIINSFNSENQGKHGFGLIDDGPSNFHNFADLIGTTHYFVDIKGTLIKNSYPSYESVTVPAGTFETIKLISKEMDYIPGLPYEDHVFPERNTSVNWFSLDSFRIAKSIDYWESPAIIAELMSY